MKTRYSPLVSIKKDAMEKKERVLQEAFLNEQKAQEALEEALVQLSHIQTPHSGKISEFLSTRTLLDAQRTIVEKNRAWLDFAISQRKHAQSELKKAMIEYEKFKYLELQEIELLLKAKKVQEMKLLDEVALLTFNKKTQESRSL